MQTQIRIYVVYFITFWQSFDKKLLITTKLKLTQINVNWIITSWLRPLRNTESSVTFCFSLWKLGCRSAILFYKYAVQLRFGHLLLQQSSWRTKYYLDKVRYNLRPLQPTALYRTGSLGPRYFSDNDCIGLVGTGCVQWKLNSCNANLCQQPVVQIYTRS